jgi:hypothetical protein
MRERYFLYGTHQARQKLRLTCECPVVVRAPICASQVGATTTNLASGTVPVPGTDTRYRTGTPNGSLIDLGYYNIIASYPSFMYIKADGIGGSLSL